MLSPLLANIYLNRFDHWFAERAMLGNQWARTRNRQAGGANFMMVRYADDFVVFSNGTKAETEAFKAEMKAWLAGELKLTLSEEKTAITHYTKGFNFLGFTVRKGAGRTSNREVVVYYPSTASVQRAARRLVELTSRKTQRHSPEDQIEALNQFLRGWGEYFRHSNASRALGYLGSRAHMRMWLWLREKSGRQGWRAIKARYLHNGTWQAGTHRLIILERMKVEYPRCRKTPNPYLGGTGIVETNAADPFAKGWTGHTVYGADWTNAREAALARTAGACAICGEAAVDVHHRKAKTKGGGNVQTNLVPLCRAHHRAAERRNSTVSHQLRELPLNSGELGASKGARPVRGGGL